MASSISNTAEVSTIKIANTRASLIIGLPSSMDHGQGGYFKGLEIMVDFRATRAASLAWKIALLF